MRPGRYALLLLGTALCCALPIFLGTWGAQVVGCRTLGRPGTFLAYCETPAFGSYEHAAYAYGLEPETVAALARAQVLFLGNSRLQMGFSTPQVDAFFRGRGVPYHLMGFGYGESLLFARRLVDRYRPRPRLVVINADPFFIRALSMPGYDVQRAPWAGRAGGWLRRAFGHVHPLLCGLPGLCPQTVGATFRDRETGQWVWKDVLLPGDTVAMAITAQKGGTWPADQLDTWVANGEDFLRALGVPRNCVLLTGVPSPAVDTEAMAARLGERLGLSVVQPALDGLTASDNSHLSAESAERWSAAFLALAAPAIDRCLRVDVPPDRP